MEDSAAVQRLSELLRDVCLEMIGRERAAGARFHIQRNPAPARRKAQRTLSSKRPR